MAVRWWDRVRVAFDVVRDRPIDLARNEIAIADTRRAVVSAIGQTIYPYNPDELQRAKGGLRIYDQMRVDDQVKACLWLTKAAVVGPGWKLEPSEQTEPARALADQLTEDLQDLDCPLDDILWEMLTSMDYGFSVTEKVYGLDAQRIVLEDLKVRAPHDFDFTSDVYGNLESVIQMQLGQRAFMSPDKFVLLQHQPEFSNWYGTSALKDCYREWWLKANWLQWWAMYGERMSVPPVIANHPLNISAGAAAEVRKRLERLQPGTVYTVPDGWTIELLQSQIGASRENFEIAIDYLNMAISRALLVPEKSGFSGGQSSRGGSYALAQEQMGAYFLVLEHYRRRLEKALDPVIAEMAAIEAGPSVNPPQFKLLPLSEDSKEMLSDLWTKAVTSGSVMSTIEDENHLRTLLGFPEREETAQETQVAEQRTRDNPSGQPPPDMAGGDGEDQADQPPEKAQPVENEELLRAFRELDPLKLSDDLQEAYARLATRYAA